MDLNSNAIVIVGCLILVLIYLVIGFVKQIYKSGDIDGADEIVLFIFYLNINVKLIGIFAISYLLVKINDCSYVLKPMCGLLFGG